jgi:hypothetical protein
MRLYSEIEHVLSGGSYSKLNSKKEREERSIPQLWWAQARAETAGPEMKPLIRRLLCCLCTPHALLSWSWHQCFARAGAHFNSRSQTLWCSRHTYWNPVGVVERATVSSAVCSDVMARNQPVSCSLRTVWATRMLKMPSARPHPPRYHLSHRPVAVAQELPRLATL